MTLVCYFDVLGKKEFNGNICICRQMNARKKIGRDKPNVNNFFFFFHVFHNFYLNWNILFLAASQCLIFDQIK